MDIWQDSIDRYNKLSNSEKIALCLYAYELSRKEVSQGLFDYINSIRKDFSLFDLPLSIAKTIN